MAYTELSLSLIRSGKAAVKTIFELLSSNFDDHEDRLSDLENSPENTTIPSGVILSYGAVTPPTGYLACDGSEVSQAVYNGLYAVIGTKFNTGSEAVGNFRVPDFRGRVPIGKGTRAIGVKEGEETHVLTTAEMPSHNHGITDPGHTHAWVCQGANTVSVKVDSDTNTSTDHATAPASTGVSINNAGSGDAHNNMAPSLVVEFIIKI